MPRGVKKEESRDDGDYQDASELPAVKGKKPKDIVGTEGGHTTLPGTEHIKITSHFPVARIKRIMQADDDVGKVAQVTPVVVSKALELFMISLVTKAATEAKGTGSKRVSTAHLKQAITKNEQFDFLSDIVAKIADAPTAADKGDGDAMEVDGKKRKAAGRRKKKTDEDEF
ncbi:histone-fold-containing protein [Amniculicola lignicola CBS 123094]|uniref:NCT transcriptional regulatory complex subunit A n=1 Tax=Amniculicola lignicola CBS 123094 TaxID=1392246 RepID=A0A6A5WMT0_9PLEO|nr:histone-fold-containing protein [Amniculicola lignicola CBS 123094]